MEHWYIFYIFGALYTLGRYIFVCREIYIEGDAPSAIFYGVLAVLFWPAALGYFGIVGD